MGLAVISMTVLVGTSIILAFFSAGETRLFRRRLVRLMGLVFPLVVFPVWGAGIFRVCLFIPCIALGLLELSRFWGPDGKPWIQRLISPIAKEGEEKHISGLAAFFWGSSLASLAPGSIGPAVMAMATISDSWGAMAGSFPGGKRTAFGKSIHGTAACFISALWMGLVFSSLFPSPGVSTVQLILTSVAIAAAERYTPGKFDNLTSPVAGAITMLITQLLIAPV